MAAPQTATRSARKGLSVILATVLSKAGGLVVVDSRLVCLLIAPIVNLGVLVIPAAQLIIHMLDAAEHMVEVWEAAV